MLNYFGYFSEIEETFVRRRGKNLLLSPLDWALIEAWKERGVPLHVVLRALENVFEAADKRSAPQKRSIKSLLYCRDEVESLYAAWLESQVGIENEKIAKQQINSEGQTAAEKKVIADAEPASAEKDWPFTRESVLRHLQNIKVHLQNAHENLNGAWENVAQKILKRLETAANVFQTDFNAEQLEVVLSELDREIDELLPFAFPTDKLAAIKNETSAQIGGFRRQMSQSAFEQTFHTLLLKNLREQAALPRMSLFYL